MSASRYRQTFKPLLLGALVAFSTLVEANPPADRMLPEQMPMELGAALIADRATFSQLAHVGTRRGSSSPKEVELIKFIVDVVANQPVRVYWINTKNINRHPDFMQEVGIPFEFGGRSGGGGGQGRDGGRDQGRGNDRDQNNAAQSRGPRGSVVLQGRGAGKQIATLTEYSPESTTVALRADMAYLADETAPDGSKGVYTYNLEPHIGLELGAVVQQAILDSLPIAKGKLAYRVSESTYREERQRYADAGIAIYADFEHFIALNPGSAVGKLRNLTDESLPSSSDIVIAHSLPNELPRVAGVITSTRQTPLSHVNLRAIQDQIPNAYIAEAAGPGQIQALLGQYVHYSVNADGYSLRAATVDEIEQQLQESAPGSAPVLNLDLSQTTIKPLSELGFADSKSVGVKAANLAVLRSLELPAGMVPDGYAVPFYFYDQFLRHNNLNEEIEALLQDSALIADKQALQQRLDALEKRIRRAEFPADLMDQLAAVQAAFPAGTSLRCRSSTNNEDLPNFSGAGLYDSYTQHPHEGHLAKSIKQVYASLWNFRAFEARELHHVDHRQVAMAVLIHPNFEGELANGVAVTEDVLYGSDNSYYANAQHGEDLVTNPEAASAPEELLIAQRQADGFRLLKPASSNTVVLIDSEIDQLRDALGVIDAGFTQLYQPAADQPFAMEVEFKITHGQRLVIKQARP